MSNYGRASNVGTVNIGNQYINHDHTSEITNDQKEKKALEKTSKDCLRSLAFPEMRERRNDIANAAINTCTWLSGDPKYLEWFKSRHGLLWIKGHPGVGKSTLMKYASDAERSRGSGICASFFFYGGGTLIQKSPLGLLRSLLHQIVQQAPSLLLKLTQIFERRCDTDGMFGEKWVWHERELQEFFEFAVVEAAKTEAIRIYIDALDECGEQAATSLVTFFQGLAESLSICFSCRYYPLVALEYRLKICVEDKNAQDIQTFVHHELNKAHYKSIRYQIISKSAGSFQWVKLVTQIVLNLGRRGTPLGAIRTRIHQIPQELSKLYEELLKSMTEDDREDDRKDSLRLMRWIHFGLRPLSLRELRTAIAVDATSSSQSVHQYQQTEDDVETDEAMERRVCDLSRGLAGAVQHGEHRVVQFVHQSVIDFLVDEGFDLLDRSQRAVTAGTFAGRSHFRLSDVCIRYLASVALPPNEYDRTMNHDLDLKFPLLMYSVVYWVEHAQKCEGENLSASSLLSYFDSSSLLEFWHSVWTMNYPSNAMDLSWPITIVHVASRYNLVHALDSVLSQSANVDLKNGHGETPLSIAARQGQKKIVELLLKRNDVETDPKDIRNRTPLSYAAQNGYETVVKLLLERNDVEADSKDIGGRSPLSWAAKSGYEAVFELLLGRDDVKADSKDSVNRTPLSYAASAGREAVVKLLLKRDDVVIDSVDRMGRTPLSHASRMGREAVVRLLIEQGNGDVNSKDCWGRTALWYANERGHRRIVTLLEQYLSREGSESFRRNESRRL